MWGAGLQWRTLSERFRSEGFVVVDGALEEGFACEVARSIQATRGRFRLVARNGVYPKTLMFAEPVAADRYETLREHLSLSRARGYFTYLYELWDLTDAPEGAAVTRLRDFLCSNACWTQFASATGAEIGACQLAGVTRFGFGHYLGEHSDRLTKFGRRRRLAFVLYFNRDWPSGAGGRLVRTLSDGTRAEVPPAWNRLVLMDVDRTERHQVLEVLDRDRERIAMPGFFCS